MTAKKITTITTRTTRTTEINNEVSPRQTGKAREGKAKKCACMYCTIWVPLLLWFSLCLRLCVCLSVCVCVCVWMKNTKSSFHPFHPFEAGPWNGKEWGWESRADEREDTATISTHSQRCSSGCVSWQWEGRLCKPPLSFTYRKCPCPVNDRGLW